ncbi:hypothetical protein N0V90_009631 [Kalmusia sp. IMI 367209]|nr:hypothetical protein N0V90_009631 [Kalmusia sp. IMI 367209]
MDYCEALREQPETDAELVMFVDNGYQLKVPCSQAAEDKELVKRLRMFYELTLAARSMIQVFGFKTSARIDIVKIAHDSAVGARIGAPLDLGRHGPYNRQIYFFRDSSRLNGTTIRDRLVSESIMTSSDTHQRALNVVRTWNPHSASVTVAMPVFCSLAVSIIWILVATLRYEADVQTSAQTGFTIGSYVVTTGKPKMSPWMMSSTV